MGASAGGFKPIDPSAEQKYRAVAPLVAPTDASAIKDAFEAPAHGPRGVFLVGFGAGAEAVESWFRSMDPGTPVHKLGFPLGWDSAEKPLLREVLAAGGGSESGKEPAPAGELPVVLLSGMSGEEAVAIIQSWQEFTGLEQPAFGTVTDALMEKPFRGLVKEISRAQVRQSGGSPPPAAAAQEVAADTDMSSKERMGQKVKEYQVVSPDGTPQSTPQSMEALKEQLQAQVKAKLAMKKSAAQAERRLGVVDETDRMRSALRDAKGKKGKKGGGGGDGKPAAKGFGA